MKQNWLLWGAVAVGAYLIYKRMNKPKGDGVVTNTEGSKPPVSNIKPPVNTIEYRSLPAERGGKATYLPNGCPTKETLARSRYTKEALDKFREMGCFNN